VKNIAKKLLLTASLFIAFSAITASAEEGYIFQLKSDVVVPLAVTDGVERITSDEPIYTAETLEDIYNFVSEDAIELIAEDVPVYLYDFPEDNPNDPYFSQQWNLGMINISSVWEKGYRGDGATICVIDSGVSTDNGDIDEDKIIGKYNVLNNNDDVTDTLGHGTFVTGIIGAETNNKKALSGIADKAELIEIKAFDSSQSTNLSAIISALNKASQYDVDVVNMSLGAQGITGAEKTLFENAINKLVKKGVIVVAAVGNDGTATLSYPAALDNVIGVGAVATNKEICYFSQRNKSVFVVAPGGVLNKGDATGYIWGLGLTANANVGGEYLSGGDGTSFSAPQVSAVATIAKSIYPDLTEAQFKQILIDTSEDLGDEGYDTLYGYGLIDADKIISEVEKLANITSTTEPTTEPTVEPTIEPTIEPTETSEPFVYDPENYQELTYEDGIIKVETTDTEAVIYEAKYDEYGVLIGIETVKLSDLEANGDTYTIEVSEEPSKLFLWHGLISCIDAWVSENYTPPIEETPTPTTEATIEPTTSPSEEPSVEETPEPSPTAEPTATPRPMADYETELLSLINQEREKNSLTAYVNSEKCTQIARGYTDGKVAGDTPSLQDLVNNVKLRFSNEECRTAKISIVSAEKMFDLIFTDDDFKAMILSEKYTDIGIGIAKYDDNYYYLTMFVCTPK
jgi:subtilisin family serine protease